MRASRLLGLLLTLQSRGPVSAAVLARAHEVSIRTIYRDVDALSAVGVPVYAETGRNGGIRLHEGYRTRLTGLTLAEAAALPVAGFADAAQDLGLSAEAAAARAKVFAALSPDGGAAAQRIAARLHVDPVSWYHRAEDVACLPALAQAVWAGTRVKVDYEGWNGGVQRRLDPLGLVLKGGLWYLVAARRHRPRTYRVASIRRLEVLDARARRPANFDLATYWRAAAATFERGLLARRADVLISAEGERILRAVMPLAADLVARTRAPCGRAGWSRAEMPYESAHYSARQLLRLGAEVAVLAPADLRAALLSEARAILAGYREASAAAPAGARGVTRTRPASRAAAGSPNTASPPASPAPASTRTPSAPAAAATSGSTRSARRSAGRSASRGRTRG
jgi:predicted DNA-binding transcriptional regulator YafY